MTVRLRFRSLEDAARAEQVLDELGGHTVLPGGDIAISDDLLPQATEALRRHGVDFRSEPVEPFTGGRVPDEERP